MHSDHYHDTVQSARNSMYVYVCACVSELVLVLVCKSY